MKYSGTSTIKLLLTLIKGKLDTKANLTDVPVKVSELTNDSGYVTTESVSGDAITEDVDFGYVSSILPDDFTGPFEEPDNI